MFWMRKFATLMLVLLAACSPTPTAANAPTSPQNSIPTVSIPPTQANAPESSGLWLQVLAPLDEAVVDTPQVDVIGSALAGAVISVNEEILIVGADLQFKTTVTLEEG